MLVHLRKSRPKVIKGFTITMEGDFDTISLIFNWVLFKLLQDFHFAPSIGDGRGVP